MFDSLRELCDAPDLEVSQRCSLFPFFYADRFVSYGVWWLQQEHENENEADLRTKLIRTREDDHDGQNCCCSESRWWDQEVVEVWVSVTRWTEGFRVARLN